jgi:hypothetical protein
VSVNLALLGGAEIQSVEGLDELTGGSGPNLWWLYPVTTLAAGCSWCSSRTRAPTPVRPGDLPGRNLKIALVVNFVVGAGLVIAMVDVPLFVNSVEIDLERSAVYSGGCCRRSPRRWRSRRTSADA